MSGNTYVVTITGLISVDTTVAVIATSDSDAARQALEGVRRDTSEWLHHEHLMDEPVVSDVSEETLDQFGADQMHLLPRKTRAPERAGTSPQSAACDILSKVSRQGP